MTLGEDHLMTYSVAAIPLPWREEYQERIAVILQDDLEPVSNERMIEAQKIAYDGVQSAMKAHWEKKERRK